MYSERCSHKDKVHNRSYNGGYKMISYCQVSLSMVMVMATLVMFK